MIIIMNKIFIEASDIIIFVFSIIGILTSAFEIISMIKSLLKRNNLNIGERSNCHSAKKKKDVVIFSIIVVVFIPVAVLSFIKTFCVSYVPNVWGLTYPEACSILAEHDLSFNTIVESNISDYIVVNQSICNDYVNKNTIIELEVKKAI